MFWRGRERDDQHPFGDSYMSSFRALASRERARMIGIPNSSLRVLFISRL
jgi:hypothetical protein